MILICVIVAQVPAPEQEAADDKPQTIVVDGRTLFYSPAIQGYVSID